jgi:adenylate cyclase
MERRLAAIMAADVVGYSRLVELDEAGTLAALKERHKDILAPLVAEHRGRIVKVMGDGVLAEFASAVNAVQCAVELQKEMAKANTDLAEDCRVHLRVGINLGDVIVEDGDLYGDGVIIGVRLQAMAEPGGICVSGAVHDQVENKLSLAFEDLGPCEVKNIGKPVQVFRVRTDRDKSVRRLAEQESKQTKPSIAVLPFANMSGDPEQEYFSDGITEDIISALSRISALWVIARTSTFTYKGKPTDVKRIAKELGVRYVMEGSVRRAADRLRVTAQLIDAATGHHLWAERYDRSIADLFDIQDEITRSVAASTETRVHMAELEAEREAAKSRPSGDFKARDLLARANDWQFDWSRETLAESFDLVEQAIRIDPSNPVAHRLRANVFLNRIYSGELPRDDANVARALEFARTALRLAPGDEYAHWVMAGAYAEAGRLEDAVAECERGLEMNPNCAAILQRLGACLAPLGRTQDAIKACRLAIQLDPRNPVNYWRHSHIAVAHFVAADYEAALQESRRVARSRQHLQSAIIWAASAAALGKADEARTAVEDCLRQRPDLRIGRVPGIVTRFARDEDHERLVAFLRKAGLPE